MTQGGQTGVRRTPGCALVIGGSGGLGAAICTALAGDWSHVVVGYHAQALRAADVVARAQASGTQALAVAVDIRSPSSAERCVAAAESFGGSVGTLIYAVGLRKHFDFVSRTPLEEWDQALKTDVLGLLIAFRAAVSGLRRARGSVIAISSYQGCRIEIKGSLSSVPKAAVDRLIAAIAKEEGRFGIRANALRVGWIDAGSGGSLLMDEDAAARRCLEIPLRRFGTAQDVGEAVAFLASPRASFITGAVRGGPKLASLPRCFNYLNTGTRIPSFRLPCDTYRRLPRQHAIVRDLNRGYSICPRRAETSMAIDGLILGRITQSDVELMRERIGYPNPTLRKGVLQKPWNTVATADAIRRWAECTGDMNPLFNDEDYAARTRWGGTVAPPGFEWSMGIDRARKVPEELNVRTHRALRGVQLYHSGAEYFYFNPIREGSKLYKSEYVADVKETKSRFACRSVIVNNETYWWDQQDRVAVKSHRWFVHAERRSVSEKAESALAEKANDVAPFYSDEQLREIEAAYDQEYQRGKDTLYLEDVRVGQELPRMVKGPLTITDMINLHMAGGWLTYGNPPYRLAYENRKRLRGFYSRNEFNAWDTVQRVHWDLSLAHSVGVKHLYDIGPMRCVMLCHYLTNFVGDDAWIHRIRYELRAFNYIGDTTWITGVVTHARIDPVLGPLIEVELKGTNQRDLENITATATVLVASRSTGLAKLPPAEPITPHRSLRS